MEMMEAVLDDHYVRRLAPHEREYYQSRLRVPTRFRFWKTTSNRGFERELVWSMEQELGSACKGFQVEQVDRDKWWFGMRGTGMQYLVSPIPLEELSEDELLERYWTIRERRLDHLTPFSASGPPYYPSPDISEASLMNRSISARHMAHMYREQRKAREFYEGRDRDRYLTEQERHQRRMASFQQSLSPDFFAPIGIHQRPVWNGF